MPKKSPNLWVCFAILSLSSLTKVKRGWQNKPRLPQTVYFISFLRYICFASLRSPYKLCKLLQYAILERHTDVTEHPNFEFGLPVKII